MNTPLQKAAQAAIDILEFGDPLPCEREAADDLQKALDAEIAQAVEPYTTCLSNCETCEYSAINPVTDGSVHCYMFRSEPIGVCASWTPIEVAPPQPQATTAVPEGYVLVPIEPTDEELANGVRAMRLFVTKNSLIDFSLGYKAMIAAAQGEKP